MKGYLLCFLLLSGYYSARSTTFYVSNNGSDALDGKSKTTAWCSLEKLITSMESMHPGDSILLERGSVFRAELIILKSGLYIGSYNQGEKPIIKGSIEIKKWSRIRPGIWMSECAECPEEPGNLFIDGEVQPLGRYPNAGYLPFSSSSHSESTITDTLVFFKDKYWSNAELVVKSSRWTLDKLPISVYQNKTFHTSSQPTYPLTKGFGYFIQKHLSTLDQPGEWFYDAPTKCLYLYANNITNPQSQLIEVSVLAFGLQAAGVDTILVENLSFQHQRTVAVQINNGRAVRLNKLEIHHSATNGMEIMGIRDVCVENCKIIGSGNNGVEWSGNTKGVFKNNVISRTGVYPGRGRSGNGTSIGLRIYSNDLNNGDNLVEQNVIDSTGYSALDFRTGNTSIKNNIISNFCLVKDDGGGIYTWENAFGGSSLTGNAISKGIGCGEGTNQPARRYAYGIYIDDRSSQLDLADNNISSCATAGIFIHNANQVNITNNKVYSNGTSLHNDERGQLYIKLDTLGRLAGKVNLNLHVSENSWIAESEEMYGVYLSASKKRDLNQLGIFARNQFEGVSSQRTVAEFYPEEDICSASHEYTLSDWQWGSHYEKESTFKVLPTKTSITKQAKNLIANGSMTSNLSGWSVWPEKSTMVRHPANAQTKPSLNAIRPQENKEILLYHGGISLEKGKLYRLTFSAKSADKANIEFVPLMEKSPWQALGDYMCFSVDSHMKSFTYYFSPAISQTQARVNFKSNSTFWLENVTLYEVKELH